MHSGMSTYVSVRFDGDALTRFCDSDTSEIAVNVFTDNGEVSVLDILGENVVAGSWEYELFAIESDEVASVGKVSVLLGWWDRVLNAVNRSEK